MLTIRSAVSLLRNPSPDPPPLRGLTFVVGSGPRARLPEGFNDSWNVATVNASQAVASSLGCRSPDLTLMGIGVLRKKPVNREAQEVIHGQGTGALIALDRRFKARVRLAFLGYSYDTFHFMALEVRQQIISDTLGEPTPHQIKPSNGIFLALLCIHLGSELVVMSGFSLTKAGHAYNDKGRDRRHVNEDRVILEKVVAKGIPIFTSDSTFASESGVPLYSSETVASP